MSKKTEKTTQEEQTENTASLFKKKKKFSVKKLVIWLSVLAVIIIVGIGLAAYFMQEEKIEYTTEDVMLGKLIQTVTATGAVESSQNIELNFKLTGKLTAMKVDEGDVVKAGQALARIDSSALSAQISQQIANVDAAKADFAKVEAGASSEDIKVTEEKATKAQNDLDSLKAERDDELATLREKTLDTLNNAIFTAPVALDAVYNNFVDDNNIANLWVKDKMLWTKVEDDYYAIKAQFTAVESAVTSANSQSTDESIVWASDQMRSLLSDLNALLNDAYNLGDSIVLNSSYSQTDKDNIKSDISTEQSTNNTSLTSLQTAKANLVTKINSYDTDIKAAENNLDIANAELNLKKAGPRDFEIHLAEAKVAQAQAQLRKLQADHNDYAIVAPIDGTVVKVNFDIGEQTSLTEPVVEMLGTEKFEVKVDIPESDIAKIEVGDKTIIELDAFGSDHLFNGTITFIDPAQTVIQDVIYYKTTVSFDPDSWNEQIKPGMTSDVTITTAEKEGVLYIPQRAVRIREAMLGEVAEKFVEVLVDTEEGIVEERIVTIGLRADRGLVEITSGLEEGEKVVVFKKNGN